MKLRKLASLALAGVLALTALPASSLAAKREKLNADDMDIPAILQATDEKGTVNVYHWWTAGGEKDAIESVVKGFTDTYTKVKAKSNAIPGGAGGAMVMKVKVLQQAGKSPETFQAHPGQEIEPYLNSDMLLNLNQVWDYGNLSERALPGLEELCTASDGNKYIVPIGIHKTNVIFYNIHVFEKYGVEIPDHQDITWDEFWALCEELAAKMPDGEYPLDLGDRKGWPACQVFENIMMGTDPQLYEDFINGDFLPFSAGIESGGAMTAVLVSHNIVACMDPDLPASLSPNVHRILREELGFDGVVMTDDLAMDAVAAYAEDGAVAVMALTAGNDLVLTTDYRTQIPKVIEAVENGTLDEAAIDAACRRVLRWKQTLGLLEDLT